MSENSSASSSSSGLGFFSILALIFITLKLTGHITWSWLWVLAPVWGPLLFLLLVVAIGLLVMGVVWLVK